ncbi:imidazole glycerol phosphate synthase subunit HisH [Stakelama pacifica]|uniref:Imidazole glycerol phosphate synthase subunit HisH n=1 Tax=Stakelama pacifica TaxID=517720 RepID=A0A4R6FPZ0_9SPHN|nr:imidazole glycerol phosphate synthase subunit HisH [Stakelama pacifica]TDN83766.1 imidazole glycerol phosphate synthase subunit HisH [Stakelama pacifica]GGO94768.1 imidazole glycerol phosphate synthase subunit HisH [Stakelama pacifica]
MTIALIDYGAGNLHSVHNALKAAGARDIAVTDDPETVRGADRVVLPGVGAFGACAKGLRAVPGMVAAMEERVLEGGAPFLGVCVGMQLMAETGEEFGEHAGLGWIAGTVAAIPPAPGLRVPHMGWNDVIPSRPHPLIEAGEAYFLHSFAFSGAHVIAISDHGGPVTAAIGRDNMVGVQFHPEKSQRYGIALLERFLEWRP